MTALGTTPGTLWSGLCEGRSGVAPLTLFDTTDFKVHFGGQVHGWDGAARFGVKEARHLDRFAQFALAAAQDAVADSGIEFSAYPPERCGVMIGSGIGGLNEFETQHSVCLERGPSRISPFTIPKLMVNAGSGHVSIKWGLRGPCSAVATACASAANAIGDALRSIQAGMADVMITGGSEAAITHMGLGGFAASARSPPATTTPRAPAARSTATATDSSWPRGRASSCWKRSRSPGPAGRGSTPSCSATACRPTARTSPLPTKKAGAPPAP